MALARFLGFMSLHSHEPISLIVQRGDSSFCRHKERLNIMSELLRHISEHWSILANDVQGFGGMNRGEV